LNLGTCVPINDRVAGRRNKEAQDKFSREAIVHLDHLYRVARYLVENPDEAQDLVQEVYARAFGSYEQFMPGSNMKAWLSRILYNLFFDHHRRNKKWVLIDGASTDGSSRGEEYGTDYWDQVPAENPGPESHVLANELASKISEALRTIPEEFRLPIVMVDMGDLSYAEAADILSCPVGTIRSRLSRGRRLIYDRLEGYVGTHGKGREKR
jgi:RNA polymerase sigma-70 factor (ECF subfamily)